MKKETKFDSDAFYAALDAERLARQCTWKHVADECGISASTLTRMSQGKHPDVNGLAALAAWSGLDADQFFRCSAAKEAPEPLAVISACLRTDPRLNRESAAALDQMIKAAYRSMTSL